MSKIVKKSMELLSADQKKLINMSVLIMIAQVRKYALEKLH